MKGLCLIIKTSEHKNKLDLLTPATITVAEIRELTEAGFTGWEKIFNHTFVNTPDGFLNEHKIKTLVRVHNTAIDLYLAENMTTSLAVLETITEQYRSSYSRVSPSKAVMNPNCSNKLLNIFLSQTVDIVRILFNMGAHFSDQTFANLASRLVNDNRYKAILSNPNCPVSVLNQFSKTDDDSLNKMLAANPALPVQEIEFLLDKYKVKDFHIISGIVRNRNLTPKNITKIWNQLLILNQTLNVYGFVEMYEAGILPSKSYSKTTIWVELVEEQNGWESYPNKTTTKMDKLELLKPYFSELTSEVPEEWLDRLIAQLGVELFTLTEDDFNVEGYRK